MFQTADALVPVGAKPYWAAATRDVEHWLLSNIDSDDISVVSIENSRDVARIPIGDHPRRVRAYSLPTSVAHSCS